MFWNNAARRRKPSIRFLLVHIVSANHLREYDGNKKKVFNQILKILACSVVVIFFKIRRLSLYTVLTHTHTHAMMGSLWVNSKNYFTLSLCRCTFVIVDNKKKKISPSLISSGKKKGAKRIFVKSLFHI